VLSMSDIPASCVNLYTDVKQPITPGTWNAFQMREQPINPVLRFAENLKRLIKLEGVSVARVAEGAKITPKQVYNLMAAGHDFRLKSIEKVANVFDLSAWQMLAVDLESKPADYKQVLELLELFAKADEDGRKVIMHVASIAAGRASK
jgi:transcriptional regulator with XRE-family HTH domain